MAATSGKLAPTVEAVKPLRPDSDSYGWRVRAVGGATEFAEAAAAGSYKSTIGKLEATTALTRSGLRGTVEAEGAIAMIGGGVFLSNRIDDAFALVETGAPDVDVMYENRPAGKTNRSGRALVPGLRAYESNRITIDPRNLPIDAEIRKTEEIVVPASRSGVRVDIAVRRDPHSAVIVLKQRDGQPLPAGSPGLLNGRVKFVVGYDGRAFLTGLSPSNEVAVTVGATECKSRFNYQPLPNEQTVISPVVCQ
jgi:outer membrane usher protein